MLSYDDIKRIAGETGCTIPDLLALSRNNDPFFAGAPAQREKAEWFSCLWREFQYATGVHLRRVHYQLVSQRNPRKHDGAPYENTETCWNYLCEAGKAARYLRLVSPTAFIDRRNPDPHIMASASRSHEEPSWWMGDVFWTLPAIDADLGTDIGFPLPGLHVNGYEYGQEDQPYHVELWVEKSTMDDVLTPVCNQLGLNLVTSLGFQSITSVIALLQRVSEADKPARIFYISDFDPAGDGMPVAVARQLEYWLSEYAHGADAKLTPLALTREQVQRYQLPRIPVKDTDKRKANFEERYGEGAVELDALEALYPGTLAILVRESVAPYRDMTLASRLAEAEEKASSALKAAWDDATRSYGAELAELETETIAIVGQYRDELEEIEGKLEQDLAPVQERLESVRQAIRNEADALELLLPERPEPETGRTDETDWLFDSQRSYGEQLRAYKARRNGHVVEVAS